ncbi:unnamed protein product [Protopolystoma xenopodis]|uniref:Uncharacterized protein n=1 Tax=Protopolystoma xenopodis TaxID=117903 RepID=A0A3S5C3U9_9PLAT|nr:unnamed protein product [Protopolystoma xenopodis]
MAGNKDRLVVRQPRKVQQSDRKRGNWKLDSLTIGRRDDWTVMRSHGLSVAVEAVVLVVRQRGLKMSGDLALEWLVSELSLIAAVDEWGYICTGFVIMDRHSRSFSHLYKAPGSTLLPFSRCVMAKNPHVDGSTPKAPSGTRLWRRRGWVPVLLCLLAGVALALLEAHPSLGQLTKMDRVLSLLEAARVFEARCTRLQTSLMIHWNPYHAVEVNPASSTSASSEEGDGDNGFEIRLRRASDGAMVDGWYEPGRVYMLEVTNRYQLVGFQDLVLWLAPAPHRQASKMGGSMMASMETMPGADGVLHGMSALEPKDIMGAMKEMKMRGINKVGSCHNPRLSSSITLTCPNLGTHSSRLDPMIRNKKVIEN